MTEPQFRNILAYVLSKVDCGHTSVRLSNKYSHYLDTARTKIFPLSIKFWPDTAAVAANLDPQGQHIEKRNRDKKNKQ